MARVLVVADDLTGANACAAGFARHGLRSVTVGLGRQWQAIAEFHARFDVVVATTESRHSPVVEATEAVSQAVRAGWPVDLVCCRIDTTLRGNVGVAAEALLSEVRELSGRRVVGLCVPTHPAAGRVTVAGNQLLGGRRLEDTELAHDVRSPMTTSSVADVLGRHTQLRSALVSMADVTGPHGELVACIRAALETGADVLVGDAIEPEHIERIAAAAVEADPSVTWCAIDPGPGSLALAGALGIRGEGQVSVPLVVAGSATDLTISQLNYLIDNRDVVVVRPIPEAGSPLPAVDATATALIDALQQATPGQIVLLASVLHSDDIHPLDHDQSEALPTQLGQITRRALQECPIGGLYTTGGDITTAVLQALDGRGIEVEDEVIPLAVAGEIVGGSWGDLPVVTKGGLIGDNTSAVVCVDHLSRAAAQRSRWVRSATPREPV